jgi:hypothetical protein
MGNEEQTIKKTIFSDFKRTSTTLREKWIPEGNCEGRKILKTGNDFPHSVETKDSPIPQHAKNIENKMIP